MDGDMLPKIVEIRMCVEHMSPLPTVDHYLRTRQHGTFGEVSDLIVTTSTPRPNVSSVVQTSLVVWKLSMNGCEDLAHNI